jgi:hypothetical protein
MDPLGTQNGTFSQEEKGPDHGPVAPKLVLKENGSMLR